MSERTQWLLKLPYPRPPLSLNQHLHHMAEAKRRAEIKADVGWLIRQQKITKGLDHVRVCLLWVARDTGRRDTDNAHPSLKPMIDALVEQGVVADDDYTHVTSAVEIAPPSGGVRPGCWLIVTARPAEPSLVTLLQ